LSVYPRANTSRGTHFKWSTWVGSFCKLGYFSALWKTMCTCELANIRLGTQAYLFGALNINKKVLQLGFYFFVSTVETSE